VIGADVLYGIVIGEREKIGGRLEGLLLKLDDAGRKEL